MASNEEKALLDRIEEQTALVNRLRKSGDSGVDDAKKELSDLKKALGLMKKAEGGEREAGKKKGRLLLKTAKVCVRTDFYPFRRAKMEIGNPRLWPE